MKEIDEKLELISSVLFALVVILFGLILSVVTGGFLYWFVSKL